MSSRQKVQIIKNLDEEEIFSHKNIIQEWSQPTLENHNCASLKTFGNVLLLLEKKGGLGSTLGKTKKPKNK